MVDYSKIISFVHVCIQSKDSLIACDGCNVNTGKHGGVIRRVELELDRPLQWLVCLLHLTKLPLREMFKNIDGITTGSRTYQGEMEKTTSDCSPNIPNCKI